MNYSKYPEFNKSGIYRIYSICNTERFYIGSAKKFRARRNMHFLDLKKNIHHSPKLQRHYNKYGKDDLIFEILEFCDVDNLIEREDYYIKLYHPYFNCNPNASSRLGTHATEETRKKQRERKIGHVPWNKGLSGYTVDRDYVITKETREKISKTLKQFFQDHPEAKDHLHNINIGKTYSEETKQKRSDALKGHTTSSETRKKISISNTGKSHPSPMKGKKQRPESIEKMRNKLIGRKDSEETRQKKAESAIRAWERRKNKQ